MNFSSSRLWIAVGVLGAVVGCGANDEGVGSLERAQEATAEAPLDVSDDKVVSPTGQPGRPFIVTSKANGTGCKPGTWQASPARDGLTFDVTFSEYEIQLSPSQTLGTKDCLLSFALRSEEGISYAVADFSYSGYALLDGGLTGFESEKYYFQGMPVGPEKRVDFKGPFDDEYAFKDEISEADMVWSPCGTDQLLQIQTRLQVRRTAGGGEGYVNKGFHGEVRFKLAWRRC